MKPKVSVLMPVFNCSQFVDEAVESILNQTLTDFEFLILDDGSSDGSEIKLKRWAKKDKRIKLIQDRQNLGLIARLNQGLELSQAKLVARMDADDISLRSRLQKQYEHLQKNKNVLALGTSIQYLSSNSSFGKTVTYSKSTTLNRWQAVFFNPLAHPTVMYRKELVIKAGGYKREALHCEDFDLWQRMLKFGEISNLPEALVYYRVHPESVSRKHVKLQKENKDKIISQNIKRLNPNINKQEMEQLIEVIDFPHRHWPFTGKAYTTLAKLASIFADKNKLTTDEKKALMNWVAFYHPLKRLPYFLLNRFQRLWYNNRSHDVKKPSKF